MPREASSREWRDSRVFAAAAAAVAMVVFALCSHRGSTGLVPAALALLVTSAAIAVSCSAPPRAERALGPGGRPRRVALFSGLGVGLGAGVGMLHRTGLGLSPWPTGGAEPFVLVACLIGATEELLYRGWLQGTLRPLGWPAAVAIAGVAHAAYKTALFAGQAGPPTMDLQSIALWTLAGGLVLGGLRQVSDSVVPCLLAHAAFDFVVYRAVARAPWWVWA